MTSDTQLYKVFIQLHVSIQGGST